MTRLHPDDIQAIAERVIFMMRTDQPQQNEIDGVKLASIRSAARADLAEAYARKAEKQAKRRAA